MKLFMLKLLIFFSALAIYTKFGMPLPFSISNRTIDKDSTFYVSADASSYVKPDTASVVLSVENTAANASFAQSSLNLTVNLVTQEIKKLGVDESNIKTVNYSIFPQYGTDGKRIESYRGSASIRVKEKDFDRLNKVLDKAVQGGANQVSGISFEVEDKEKAVDEARSEAIKKAKTKATKIASEAGIKLGRIINVTEYTPIDYPIYALDTGGKGGGGPQTEIQPGQTEVKVSVTLSYETL